MNDNEILIIAWWISLFTSVTAKSTSWSTVLFRPSHFFSLFEFKSSSCCQTTSLGAIHYFALPIRIFHFSREFATPVCQVKCYSATTSSSLSSVQRVANLRLPWGVEAFYKTKKGPEDHCPIPGIMLSIKVSQAASPQTLVSQQRRQARWGGRGGVPRVPAVGAGHGSAPEAGAVALLQLTLLGGQPHPVSARSPLVVLGVWKACKWDWAMGFSALPR